MTIKTAVIGVGSMGKNHARIYWELPDVKLVGVADLNQTVSESIAHHYSTDNYSDYRQMLDEQKPDAVTICVPTSSHVDVGLEVIKRGIHLLVEKPISCTVDEGNILIDAAEKAGVKLMIGHIERFNPAITALKEKLANNKLGKVFKVEARREGPLPQRINDVGVVIDLAVHDLDIIRYVTQKEITRIYAETMSGIHSQYEDLMSGLICLSDGTVGNLIINWITPTKIREFSVTGELGMFKVDYITQDLYFYENSLLNESEWSTLGLLRGVREGSMVRYHINKKEPLRAEQEAFLAAIQDDSIVPVTGQDGLKALELAQALVHSGKKHKLVFLNNA
ncbi:MAG: Gfo/Idh/MocA family oxidoreductase [Anaerolineaceae bacterium]|jgi:predicted dehydrogenase|nr:Gfo/Idh/MocA family oxidoreductase [Anaerolineaceae bacterium]